MQWHTISFRKQCSVNTLPALLCVCVLVHPHLLSAVSEPQKGVIIPHNLALFIGNRFFCCFFFLPYLFVVCCVIVSFDGVIVICCFCLAFGFLLLCGFIVCSFSVRCVDIYSIHLHSLFIYITEFMFICPRLLFCCCTLFIHIVFAFLSKCLPTATISLSAVGYFSDFFESILLCVT